MTKEQEQSVMDLLMEDHFKVVFWQWARCHAQCHEAFQEFLKLPPSPDPWEHYAKYEAAAGSRDFMQYWIQHTGYKIT